MKRLFLGLLVVSTLLLAACSQSDGTRAMSDDEPLPDPLPAGTVQAPCDTVPSLEGHGPGDVLAAVELTDQYQDDPAFPKNARTWRILYASASVDEQNLVAVCGMVVAPKAAPATESGSGRMLAWAHGTQGVQATCQPSVAPETYTWGATPAGIGAVAWGSKLTGDLHQGLPENGILATAINRGWVVTATDYYADPNGKMLQPYVLGSMAGANVLDSARAAGQLLGDEFDDAGSAYDLALMGHSQGGHAAMFAGQLANDYLGETSQSVDQIDLTLKGAALLAPAANISTLKDGKSTTALGHSLIDEALHEVAPLFPVWGALSPKLGLGPLFLTYSFGSWNNWSQVDLSDSAKFPAYPRDAQDIPLDAIFTGPGLDTINEIGSLCPASDVKQLQAALKPYNDALTHQMMNAQMWNVNPPYTPGEHVLGGIDKTCLETTDPAQLRWCEWSRYNTLGPLGTNPFDTFPNADGQPLPILIAQGSQDTTIWCDDAGQPGEVPAATDCMSTALYSPLTKEYCPSGNAKSTLKQSIYRQWPGFSPASHMSIPGQASSASTSADPNKLVFTGSEVDQFLVGVFEGSLKPGCAAAVVNKNG